MKTHATMQRGEERRVPMSAHDLMLTVRKLHGPCYRVTVYRVGETTPTASVVVNSMDAACTCGTEGHCLHRGAVRQADEAARRLWAADVPAPSPQAPGAETT